MNWAGDQVSEPLEEAGMSISSAQQMGSRQPMCSMTRADALHPFWTADRISQVPVRFDLKYSAA